MYYIIGTENQYKNVTDELLNYIPEKVCGLLHERVKTFDSYYGAHRDLEKDLGGYCAVFPTMQVTDNNTYSNLLKKHFIRLEDWEYQDYIVCDKSIWCEELYILSSDYSLIIIYPCEEEK
ncbi:hypothetical protein [Clostridium transplantifaecale]|uniref:hypothetical protein n=1 Tax=Clostridium transplantifaecale TaxID=2479838 RepID=UPI000F6347FF|nr:hypothetical protein [Clostridium transplantifaecale]